jgi:hypothetical protein
MCEPKLVARECRSAPRLDQISEELGQLYPPLGPFFLFVVWLFYSVVRARRAHSEYSTMDHLSHDRRIWMPEYMISILAFSTVLLGVRLISRIKRFGGYPGIDDVFITLAWLFSIASGTCVLLGTISPHLLRGVYVA